MLEYIVRRLVLAGFTIWVISVLAFVIIELPAGDQVDRFKEITESRREIPDPDKLKALRSYLGLDRPQYVRYGMWMWNLMHGDLGVSFQYRRDVDLPIKELIGNRLWMTIVLTGFTVVVTWTFAIPVGIYSAVRQHSIGDYVFTFLGFSGLAVPDFLLGLVLMYVAFAYFDQSVGGLNSADYANAPWDGARLVDLLNHLWIPAVVLGTSGTASLVRIMRNNLLDELGKPYVVTARAKGMNPLRVILKYPVRVAINPLVSTVGYLLPALVSGSIIVSVVLSLPTLGPLLLEGILTEDVFLAGFIILMTGILTVIGTLVSDILLAVVDPRIKYTGK
jgi:peptide/nickel transport system permease protein